MIDIDLIRNNPDVVRADLKKRQSDFPLDELINADKKWRQLKLDADKIRKERNDITLKIPQMKKDGKDTATLQEKVRKINEKIKENEEELGIVEEKRRLLWLELPNITHESVPYGTEEKDNIEVRKWGKIRDIKNPKNHLDIIESMGLIDLERGAKVAGARFYYIQGKLAELDYALQRYAIDFMIRKGHILVEPPYMMNRKAYEGVVDLGDFETMMYKIENEDLYLIATAEHPMTARFMDETIDIDSLPLKFVGISPCFRREVGSHGKYSKGLFRMHQFNKVEQMIFSKPEDSWKYHEELQRNTEEMFQGLEMPYRVVNTCTGELGTVAAKKYDIELWLPSAGEYKEEGSNSNCTDYQARRLNIRYGKEGGEKSYVHTLNNTAIATSRAMVAILENNQNDDGSVDMPKALHPYMSFKKLG